MARSIWKGPFVDYPILKKIKYYKTKYKSSNVYSKKALNKTKDENHIKTWSRRSVILPQFINLYFEIHNGKSFNKIKISESMIGHKFGEFSSTRKKCIHNKK